MAGVTDAADLKAALSASGLDAKAIGAAISAWCAPARLECSPPFLVSWYNQTRAVTAGSTSLIEAPDNAVAFALYSIPGYLDVIAEYFARERPATNFVDGATNEILESLRNQLPTGFDGQIVNTDIGPPYYHVQTVGAVAGVDQHIEAEDVGSDEWRKDLGDRLDDERDPKMWGTDPATRRKVFAVNVHPHWGGWYAYRALVILRGFTEESLPRPEPVKFLPEPDAMRILEEYNLRHQHCLWRDLDLDNHPPDRRYLPEEYLFFTETSPAKRERYLRMRADQMAAPSPKRVS